MTIACYPGSFDPVTNGHIDVIERATRAFDQVVVAVIENPGKQALFTVSERVDMLRDATSHLEGVKVDSFVGLVVDFCKRVGSDVLVKGLRGANDFDYELHMAQMNSRMGVDTVFLVAKPGLSYVASSLMKEVVRYGGSVEGLVPEDVARRLTERLRGD